MSTRLHFFILVLVFLTTLNFNEVAPQTPDLDQKAHRLSAHGGPYDLLTRYGSNARVLEQNRGSHPQSVPETKDDPGDMIVSKKIKIKPKHASNPNKRISPVPAPKD